MKLDRITLENFGVYSRQEFVFNSSPLIVVYGPNEAGKTTALNGFRQALFGFKARTAYRNPSGLTMRAEVEARMRSGKQLVFSRRKGRPDAIECSLAGNTLREGQLSELFNDLDLASYESLFGFSQDELEVGQEVLRNAKLSEALSGGGFGGLHRMERLRSELQERMQELYKQRGTNPEINASLGQLRSTSEQLKAVEVLPARVEELRRQLQEAQRLATQHTSSLQQNWRSIEALQKKLEALPQYATRCTLSNELENLDLPINLEPAFVHRWSEAAGKRKELAARVEELAKAVKREQTELEGLGGDDRLLDHETHIERLGHRADKVRQHRLRRDEIGAAQSTNDRRIQECLSRLGIKSVPEGIEQFILSMPERQRLVEASNQLKSLNAELIEARTRLEVLTDSQQQRYDEQEVPPENLDELAGKVSKLEELEQKLQQQVEKFEGMTTSTDWRQAESQIRALLPEGVELDPQWHLPGDDSLERWEEKYSELCAQRTQLRQQSELLEKELGKCHIESSNANTNRTNESLASLQDLSAQRSAIIEQWLDELSQPLIAASISVEQQQERLEELNRISDASDAAIDDVVGIADAIAEANQWRLRTAELQQQRAELGEQQERLRAVEDQLLEDWKLIWKQLPWLPDHTQISPQWRSRWTQWKSAIRDKEQAHKETHRRRSALKAHQVAVMDVWPVLLRDEPKAGTLGQCIAGWREALKLRVEREISQRETKRQKEQVGRRVKELEDSVRATESICDTFAESMPIEAGWPREEIVSAIDLLDRLRTDCESGDALRHELEQLEQALQEFEESAASLSSQLGDVLDAEPHEDWAERKLQQLTDVRRARERRVQLGTGLEHRRTQLSELEEELASLDESLAALCATVDRFDQDGIAAMMDRWQRAEAIQLELSRCNASLRTLAPHGDLNRFLAELDQTTASELQMEIGELESEGTLLETQRKQTEQQIGSIEQQLDAMQSAGRSQELSQALHSHRGRLAELSEEWIVLRIADRLLQETTESYAADHEPAILPLIRKYLQQLTGGRYVDIERDVDGEAIIVRAANNQAFPTDRLSKGTRQQLYLAIRMAFISHYQDHSEPLPVIMDDCFVHFDDSRTLAALQAINHWGADTQTVILSCHARIPRMVASFAPETPVLQLDKQEFGVVGQVDWQSVEQG